MKTIRVFLSGVAVYFLVAILHACGDSAPAQVAATSSGAGGEHGTGGAGGAKPSTSIAASGSGMGGFGGMMNPVPDADANESGTRLKVKYMAGGDGSKSFFALYDSLLKENCSYVTMTDGTSRCAPTGILELASSKTFLESTCSTQVVLVNPTACGGVPGYLRGTSDSCNGGPYIYKVFPIGAIVPGTIVYYLAGGVCKPQSLYVWQEIRTLGAEMPPSSFVAGTLTIDP
jgi:hypothetical protein